MAQACRDEIKKLWREYSLPNGANASLIRDRFLLYDVNDKDKDKDKTHGVEAKKGLYAAMHNAMVPAARPYGAAFERYITSLDSFGNQGNFETLGRLVIGLGSENVLETGITLHHTYGTPVIPGSALKGLASHYCDQVWGADESNVSFRKNNEYHNQLFGTNDDSGHIVFHDAWITPESLKRSLKRDIMTPHHGDYYSGKDDAPTDFDEPNPISFLSLSGIFHIAVTCDIQDANGKEWEKLAFQILSEALCNWGIGGKTSAGYGRLVKIEGVPPEVKKPASPNSPGNVTIAGNPYHPGNKKYNQFPQSGNSQQGKYGPSYPKQ
nr:type III-B CRISPR module RAMP protein Cmr6 [uncultured Methanoregula sp.]